MPNETEPHLGSPVERSPATSPASSSTASPPAAFPPLPQQARNVAGAIFRALQALSQGEPVLSPEATLRARLTICRGCISSVPKEVDVEHRRCVACGCYLFAKAKLETETCPDARW